MELTLQVTKHSRDGVGQSCFRTWWGFPYAEDAGFRTPTLTKCRKKTQLVCRTLISCLPLPAMLSAHRPVLASQPSCARTQSLFYVPGRQLPYPLAPYFLRSLPPLRLRPPSTFCPCCFMASRLYGFTSYHRTFLCAHARNKPFFKKNYRLKIKFVI